MKVTPRSFSVVCAGDDWAPNSNHVDLERFKDELNRKRTKSGKQDVDEFLRVKTFVSHVWKSST